MIAIAGPQEDIKRDRKEEILQVAADLFTQNGYEQVSMRGIADALGISVGNLTYYFKTKEDLVEAVVLRGHEEYRRPLPPKGLAGLHRLFLRLLKSESGGSFYFGLPAKDFQSERLQQLRAEVNQDFSAALQEGFANLERAGFILKEEPRGSREGLFEVFKLIAAHPDGRTKQDQLQMVWGLILPLLTGRGKRAFKNEVLVQRETL